VARIFTVGQNRVRTVCLVSAEVCVCVGVVVHSLSKNRRSCNGTGTVYLDPRLYVNTLKGLDPSLSLRSQSGSHVEATTVARYVGGLNLSQGGGCLNIFVQSLIGACYLEESRGTGEMDSIQMVVLYTCGGATFNSKRNLSLPSKS